MPPKEMRKETLLELSTKLEDKREMCLFLSHTSLKNACRYMFLGRITDLQPASYSEQTNAAG